MRWRRGKEEVVVYKRLASGGDCTEGRVPRGHVPVIVGRDDAEAERFVVHVRVFKDPCIVMLLDMAANEFGNHQPGVLRIPCDVDRFRRIIEVIYKPRL